MSPKNAQATRWRNAPPVSPSVGPLHSTTRMYGPAHYRAGNSVVGAVLGLRLSGPHAGPISLAPVGSYAWRLIRRLPHHLPRGPRRRPFLPATPASSPSPLLSCSAPPPSVSVVWFLGHAYCVYNNSHHFRSLLIAPSLFLPSILRVDPVAVRACSIGGESPG